jgi:hypothetical protein
LVILSVFSRLLLLVALLFVPSSFGRFIFQCWVVLSFSPKELMGKGQVHGTSDWWFSKIKEPGLGGSSGCQIVKN